MDREQEVKANKAIQMVVLPSSARIELKGGASNPPDEALTKSGPPAPRWTNEF
jgi:hypothetical protein